MGVYNTSGVRQTRAGLPVTAFVDPDPLLVVTAQLYSKKPYYGDHGDDTGEGSEYQLLANAGQVVRTSQVNAWFAPASLVSASPSTGVAAAGGATITMTGTGLDGVTAVQVGGTAATNLVVVNATTLTFTAPAKTAGTYSITATDDSGTLTETNAITYV